MKLSEQQLEQALEMFAEGYSRTRMYRILWRRMIFCVNKSGSR